VFYNFTRRYGERIIIRRVIENDIDYATGLLERTYREETIRNAVYIPPITERNVTYTPAMMQAIRQYAWQGSGQDMKESGFLFADRDLRNWDGFDPTQRIRWRDQTHEVVRIQKFDGGTIIWTKLALSNHEDDEGVTPTLEGVGFWEIGSTFEVS
jgi:hypothetical protein